MIVKMVSTRAPGVAETAPGSNGPIRSPRDADVLRENVADALAQASSQAAESVRAYARYSRAQGDSLQEVVEVLMKLVRDTTPETKSLPKRSCEVADWAIAAYQGESEPVHLRGTVRLGSRHRNFHSGRAGR
jgi:hypothetical protein